ncbi:MFS family permease [Elusimicrobium simillimum]|uniref:MFS transporter n=1 Tax=Elusimicrobium simillimum TaxID=3143438 RepID=UPI003C703F2A
MNKLSYKNILLKAISVLLINSILVSLLPADVYAQVKSSTVRKNNTGKGSVSASLSKYDLSKLKTFSIEEIKSQAAAKANEDIVLRRDNTTVVYVPMGPGEKAEEVVESISDKRGRELSEVIEGYFGLNEGVESGPLGYESYKKEFDKERRDLEVKYLGEISRKVGEQEGILAGELREYSLRGMSAADLALYEGYKTSEISAWSKELHGELGVVLGVDSKSRYAQYKAEWGKVEERLLRETHRELSKKKSELLGLWRREPNTYGKYVLRVSPLLLTVEGMFDVGERRELLSLYKSKVSKGNCLEAGCVDEMYAVMGIGMLGSRSDGGDVRRLLINSMDIAGSGALLMAGAGTLLSLGAYSELDTVVGYATREERKQVSGDYDLLLLSTYAREWKDRHGKYLGKKSVNAAYPIDRTSMGNAWTQVVDVLLAEGSAESLSILSKYSVGACGVRTYMGARSVGCSGVMPFIAEGLLSGKVKVDLGIEFSGQAAAAGLSQRGMLLAHIMNASFGDMNEVDEGKLDKRIYNYLLRTESSAALKKNVTKHAVINREGELWKGSEVSQTGIMTTFAGSADVALAVFFIGRMGVSLVRQSGQIGLKMYRLTQVGRKGTNGIKNLRHYAMYKNLSQATRAGRGSNFKAFSGSQFKANNAANPLNILTREHLRTSIGRAKVDARAKQLAGEKLSIERSLAREQQLNQISGKKIGKVDPNISKTLASGGNKVSVEGLEGKKFSRLGSETGNNFIERRILGGKSYGEASGWRQNLLDRSRELSLSLEILKDNIGYGLQGSNKKYVAASLITPAGQAVSTQGAATAEFSVMQSMKSGMPSASILSESGAPTAIRGVGSVSKTAPVTKVTTASPVSSAAKTLNGLVGENSGINKALGKLNIPVSAGASAGLSLGAPRIIGRDIRTPMQGRTAEEDKGISDFEYLLKAMNPFAKEVGGQIVKADNLAGNLANGAKMGLRYAAQRLSNKTKADGFTRSVDQQYNVSRETRLARSVAAIDAIYQNAKASGREGMLTVGETRAVKGYINDIEGNNQHWVLNKESGVWQKQYTQSGQEAITHLNNNYFTGVQPREVKNQTTASNPTTPRPQITHAEATPATVAKENLVALRPHINNGVKTPQSPIAGSPAASYAWINTDVTAAPSRPIVNKLAEIKQLDVLHATEVTPQENAGYIKFFDRTDTGATISGNTLNSGLNPAVLARPFNAVKKWVSGVLSKKPGINKAGGQTAAPLLDHEIFAQITSNILTQPEYNLNYSKRISIENTLNNTFARAIVEAKGVAISQNQTDNLFNNINSAVNQINFLNEELKTELVTDIKNAVGKNFKKQAFNIAHEDNYLQNVKLSVAVESAEGKIDIDQLYDITVNIKGTKKDISNFTAHINKNIPYVNKDNHLVFYNPKKDKINTSFSVHVTSNAKLNKIADMVRNNNGKLSHAQIENAAPAFDLSVRNVSKWSRAIYATSLINGFVTLYSGANIIYLKDALDLSKTQVAGFSMVTFTLAVVAPHIASALKNKFGKKNTLYIGAGTVLAGGLSSIIFGAGHMHAWDNTTLQYAGFLLANLITSAGVFITATTAPTMVSNYTGDRMLTVQKSTNTQRTMAVGVMLGALITSPLSAIGIDPTAGLPILSIGSAIMSLALVATSKMPNFRYNGFVRENKKESSLSLLEQLKWAKKDPEARRLVTTAFLMNGAEVAFMMIMPVFLANILSENGSIGTMSLLYSSGPFLLGRFMAKSVVNKFGIFGGKVFAMGVSTLGILTAVSTSSMGIAPLLMSIAVTEYGISTLFTITYTGLSAAPTRESILLPLIHNSALGAALIPMALGFGADMGQEYLMARGVAQGAAEFKALSTFFFYAPVSLFLASAALMSTKTGLKEFLRGLGFKKKAPQPQEALIPVQEEKKTIIEFFSRNKKSDGGSNSGAGYLFTDFGLGAVFSRFMAGKIQTFLPKAEEGAKVTKPITLSMPVQEGETINHDKKVTVPFITVDNQKKVVEFEKFLEKNTPFVSEDNDIAFVDNETGKINASYIIRSEDGKKPYIKDADEFLNNNEAVRPEKIKFTSAARYTAPLYWMASMIGFEGAFTPQLGVIQRTLGISDFATTAITAASFTVAGLMPFISAPFAAKYGKRTALYRGLTFMLAGAIASWAFGFGHFSAWDMKGLQLAGILASAGLISVGADMLANSISPMISSFTGEGSVRVKKSGRAQIARAAGSFAIYFAPMFFIDKTTALPAFIIPMALVGLAWLKLSGMHNDVHNKPKTSKIQTGVKDTLKMFKHEATAFKDDLRTKFKYFKIDPVAQKTVAALILMNFIEMTLGSAGPMIFERVYSETVSSILNIATFPIPFFLGRLLAPAFIRAFGETRAKHIANVIVVAGTLMATASAVNTIALLPSLFMVEFGISTMFGISFASLSRNVDRERMLLPFFYFTTFGCAVGPLLFGGISTYIFNDTYLGMIVAPVLLNLPITLLLLNRTLPKGFFGLSGTEIAFADDFERAYNKNKNKAFKELKAYFKNQDKEVKNDYDVFTYAAEQLETDYPQYAQGTGHAYRGLFVQTQSEVENIINNGMDIAMVSENTKDDDMFADAAPTDMYFASAPRITMKYAFGVGRQSNPSKNKGYSVIVISNIPEDIRTDGMILTLGRSMRADEIKDVLMYDFITKKWISVKNAMGIKPLSSAPTAYKLMTEYA